jgi:hypothetical protein
MSVDQLIRLFKINYIVEDGTEMEGTEDGKKYNTVIFVQV